ncbi:MAG: hypothetical protein FWD64_05425 [Acidobacteriaceae bacterium]|nr:hypothetical protein [Acidobacteriaceae bacterium]
MKKVLIALIGIVVLSTVAFAQTPLLPTGGTTPWSKECTTAAPAAGTASDCTVQGYTTLVATKVEGLTLIIPNEISFVIANGQKYNQGNQPLTATTSWVLSNANATGYTNIAVTAYFLSDTALTSNDGSGNVITTDRIIGKLDGGSEVRFDGSATNFLVPDANVTAAMLANGVPMYEVPVTTGSQDGGISGTVSYNMNLYIDDSDQLIAPISGAFTYQGTLWVTATAL